MSDSLGDGQGNPTDTQNRLYQRWAQGGIAAMIVGEVQCSPYYAEKPGNLVLNSASDVERFKTLAQIGTANQTHLWLQLGHAGAMAHPAISKPKGPSEIQLPDLRCQALSLTEIQNLPAEFANTARLAQALGFSGVQIHAAHGFLLSQFLSPLFNQRGDHYGGSINNRMRLLLEVLDEVRSCVEGEFAVTLKLNSTDQLGGGFEKADALKVVKALNTTGIDLVDISGGTYFPGAPSASDRSSSGPYFVDFAIQAKSNTNIPVMVTGGFKTLHQANIAIERGIDVVGLARSLVLSPDLPHRWLSTLSGDPTFPQFSSPPEGGVTAWYTMRLTELGQDSEKDEIPNLEQCINAYEERDRQRSILWKEHFLS